MFGEKLAIPKSLILFSPAYKIYFCILLKSMLCNLSKNDSFSAILPIPSLCIELASNSLLTK